VSETVTLFGANGFVGRALARKLESDGVTVRRVSRESWPESGTHIGHAIYAIGLTANFRGQVRETFASHSGKLAELVERYRFESLLYLSSTRVYRGACATHEDTQLHVRPADPDDTYNISKLAGESLVLGLDHSRARVARLSNVYGGPAASASFLSSVQLEASQTGSCQFLTGRESEKDYIHIDDAVCRLAAITLNGTSRLYNVAAGENISNADIASLLGGFGVRTAFQTGAPVTRFLRIDTTRADDEFGTLPVNFASRFEQSFRQFKEMTA
jgi:nucleoside-diphosphate-sugar epimerase